MSSLIQFALMMGVVQALASEGIDIHRIDFDGSEYTVPSEGAITVVAVSGRLAIDFSGPVEEGLRLRYRLDGVDKAWRDPPNSMRILLNFLDERKEIVGSRDFLMQGETPGWNSGVETSTFLTRNESTLVPPLSQSVTISILSHGEDGGVGIVGVDRLVLQATPVNGGPSRSFPLDSVRGPDMELRPGSPSWYRGYGSRAEIAEIRIRPRPTPHPILVLNDTDPLRYGNWSLINRPILVAEGDRVSMSWEEAHSIGRSGRHQAEYPRLKPGKYVFRAALCTVDGVPTDRVLAIPFTILLPWHQRWYFWVGVVTLASGLGAWAGHAFKRRRLIQRLKELERSHALERERERIARDLHDNVGAGLTEIAMLSDWVRDDLEVLQDSASKDRVERIRQSAVELARSVDEIVWAINPANDDLKRFANYLMQASSQFLGATDIRVRYHISQDLQALPISGKIRHNLFLVVREILNNTVKYAEATFVRIELEESDRIIRLVVEDDGKGFVVSQVGPEGTHQGLAGMERRMTDIGGVLHLTSYPDKGTRVELQVHVPPGSKGKA